MTADGASLVSKVLLVVCDGMGVGAAPDAERYGDQGSDTMGNCARAVGGLHLPNLERLGLGCLTDIEGLGCEPGPGTAHGRLMERSAAKDSTTGHWEIAGVVTDRGFPTYPQGFPPEIVGPFEEAIGRRVLGNRPASGTDIIEELGVEHLRTGEPIVYTSGDSVFQIACHLDVADLETLYGWCRTARSLLVGAHGVGRVIARPFVGTPGDFLRTADRRDYSLPPPTPTLLDRCREAGVAVYGVGKIGDIFTMRGISESRYSSSNDDGVDRALDFLGNPRPSLVFVNLVDMDTKYGHRNDPPGYAASVEAFDRRIPDLLAALGGGVVFITSDHGCDPTTPSTDHSREMVPMLAAGLPKGPVDIGTRPTFADLGATVGSLLGVSTEGLAGDSFARDLGF
jgi:phosphopentomutase